MEACLACPRWSYNDFSINDQQMTSASIEIYGFKIEGRMPTFRLFLSMIISISVVYLLLGIFSLFLKRV